MKAHIHCSSGTNFISLPIALSTRSSRVKELFTEFREFPIKLKGMINENDEFYIINDINQDVSGISNSIEVLRFFYGVGNGRSLFPDGSDQLNVLIGTFDSSGALDTVEQKDVSLDYFHLDFNILDPEKSAGCEFVSGPLFWNKTSMSCTVVHENSRYPGCYSYLDHATCSRCLLSYYYQDPFRRGRCRHRHEGCPHDKGVFEPPTSWAPLNRAYCLTCPLNTKKCYSKGKWAEKCFQETSGNSVVSSSDGYTSCGCIQLGCEVCEMTNCDKCSDEQKRYFMYETKKYTCSYISLYGYPLHRNMTSLEFIHRKFILWKQNNMSPIIPIPQGLVGYKIVKDESDNIVTPVEYEACDPETMKESGAATSSYCDPDSGAALPVPSGQVCKNSLRFPYLSIFSNINSLDDGCDDITSYEDKGCQFYNSTNSCQKCSNSMIPVRSDSMNYECNAPTWVLKLAISSSPNTIWVPCPLPNCKILFPNSFLGDKCSMKDSYLVCRTCSKGYLLSEDKSYCDCKRDSDGNCVNCPSSCIKFFRK